MLLAAGAGLAQSTQAVESQLRRHPADRPGATLASREQLRIVADDRAGVTLAAAAQVKSELVIDAGRICTRSWIRASFPVGFHEPDYDTWPPEFRQIWSFNVDGSMGLNSASFDCPVSE